jgi:hypothetical protein
VSLPTSRRCNVDLQAPHGEIETDVDEVKLTADGHYGSAVLMGGGRPAPYVKRPTIRVIAGGDLYFTGAARE